MKKRALIPLAIVVITVGILARTWLQKSAAPLNLEYSTKNAFASKGVAMIPWRDPESDIKHVFPGATIPDTGNPTIIPLSRHRLTLIKKLGQLDSNALYAHKIQGKGVVLLRRTKGESGAIEVVLFITTDNTVAGVIIQRHREPAIIAKQLLDPAFLNAFKGLAPTSTFPTFKNTSEQAVSDAIRAMLVEYDAGSRA